MENWFVDCNIDQAEGLTWDEVELCEVDCHDQEDDKDDDDSVKTNEIEFEFCINFVRNSVIDFIGGVAIPCCTYAHYQHQNQNPSNKKSNFQERYLVLLNEVGVEGPTRVEFELADQDGNGILLLNEWRNWVALQK